MGAGETLSCASARGARQLADAGIDDAALDARLLLGWVLGMDRLELLRRANEALPPAAAERFSAALAARAGRRPVSRITGERWFWDLRLKIDGNVLDPRPESEGLVEAVLTRVDHAAPLRLLDLGTGSGCLLLALLAELGAARGLGVDRSDGALACAAANAEVLGLAARATFRLGDWASALDGPFDVVVANPPYIPTSVIDELAPEVVHHDPRGALDGGADGLDAYRAIMADLPRVLAPEGFGVIELGIGQADAVTEIAGTAGLRIIEIARDLAGIERCLVVGARKESIDR